MLTRIDYNGGYLWVNKEAECPIGEYLYLEKGGLYETHIVTINYGRQQNSGDGFKVVAKSPNLSIPNVPYVEFVENIERLAEIEANKEEWDFDSPYGNGYNDFINGFTKGHLIAQSKGRYSEEDLREAIVKSALSETDNLIDRCDEIIQSLNQPPQEIEIETKQVCGNMSCLRMALNGENSTCCGESIVTIPITYMRDGKTYLKVKQ
jgi:hypothetical protein